MSAGLGFQAQNHAVSWAERLGFGIRISSAPAVPQAAQEAFTAPVKVSVTTLKDVVVPETVAGKLASFIARSKNAVQELGSVGYDLAKAAGYVAWAPCKFIADHPEASLVAAVGLAGRAYYMHYILPVKIKKECDNLDYYIHHTYNALNIDNSAYALMNFHVDENIEALKSRLLWNAGIYYRVKYGSVVAEYLYSEEIEIIERFCNLIRIARATHHHTNIQQVQQAARAVKMMLTRRLGIEQAAQIMR